MPTFETKDLTLGDLQVSSKGAKQFPLNDREEPLLWKPGPLHVLWQPSAFKDPEASRVTICFSSTPEVESYLHDLESWVLKTVASAPKKFFGVDLTQSQVQEKYSPVVKVSQKGYAHIKAKMNIAGKNSVRCWDAETRAQKKQPEDWTMCEVQPSFHVKGVWVMNKDFGILIEMTDALTIERSNICPF